MKQHIIVTTEDPLTIYEVKQEMLNYQPNENRVQEVLPTHIIIGYLGTDNYGRIQMHKSKWRMDIFISDEGEVKIKKNFGGLIEGT
jgi:hypothetical protein